MTLAGARDRTLRLAMALLTLTPLAVAAERRLDLQVSPPGSSLPPTAPAPGRPSTYQPAPLPNRDVEIAAPRATNGPSVGPSLFTRPDQFRGDGFGKGSTAQAEQEKRVRPGAGFSLKLPFSPN